MEDTSFVVPLHAFSTKLLNWTRPVRFFPAVQDSANYVASKLPESSISIDTLFAFLYRALSGAFNPDWTKINFVFRRLLELEKEESRDEVKDKRLQDSNMLSKH